MLLEAKFARREQMWIRGFMFPIFPHLHWTMTGQLSIILNLIQKRENAERKTHLLTPRKWSGKYMYEVNHKQSWGTYLNVSLVVLLLTWENHLLTIRISSLLRSVYFVCLKNITYCNCLSPSSYSLPHFVQNIGKFGAKNLLQTIEQLIQFSYTLFIINNAFFQLSLRVA